MFSGIVEETGIISHVEARKGGLHLAISAGGLELEDVQPGDSIAVNGVCLTVVQKDSRGFAVDISDETLKCTTGLSKTGSPVNLEKALRLSDRLDGHLVSGHVDGVGEVTAVTLLGENRRLTIRAPQPLTKYLAVKGSIAINGVSLTINEVQDSIFSVNLIPHTLAVTALAGLRADDRVNLEVDMIARYVERLLGARQT